MTNGISIHRTVFKVGIDGFSVDAPAKSLKLKIKGHAGFDSCIRFKEEGEYLKNRASFPFTKSCFIHCIHDDYVTRKNKERHVGFTISILSDLPGLNIVDTFGLD